MRNEGKQDNIVKFHRQIHVNVGFVICLIILIYLIFHVFTYLTSNNVSVYEVKQGEIMANYEYTALAVRQEEIVNADITGYPYYYKKNHSEVGAKSVVYAMDETGEITTKLYAESENDTNATALDESAVEKDIYAFMAAYSGEQFQKLYTFKSDLTDALAESYNETAVLSLAGEIEVAQANNTYHTYTAANAGLLVYSLDGYEGLTLDEISPEQLDLGKVDIKNLRTKEEIASGTPVYKLITSDHWQLVLEVEPQVLEQVTNEEYIEIRFDADDARCWAEVSTKETAGKTLLVLSLDDSVERYADDRFLAVELLLEQQSGLKIPNSSIVEKTFFTVPKSYFFQGNDSDEPGVIKKDGDLSTFIIPTTYFETDDYYYIDGESVSEGDVLLKTDSTETYVVGTDTEALTGVYSVNKGYTVFKRIEIIYQSEDYAIIQTGTKYGVSLYDRIVLQGDRVKEDEIL